MTDELVGKRFCIFGLPGSGKSYLASYILSRYPRHMIYDIMDEFSGYNRYVPQREYFPDNLPELDRFYTEWLRPHMNEIDLFIIDEANRVAPNQRKLCGSLLELNDQNRHLEVGFGTIARRPTQLNTDFIELAHILFIFRLQGKNDVKYLNDVVDGLGDTVKTLNHHRFCVVREDRSYFISSPVKSWKQETGSGDLTK
ncbi:MAG: hypothetical protein SVM80_13730 [Halobacteriota archaeon]|nr:hypothetical protein [Halobacteriota archaeon]